MEYINLMVNEGGSHQQTKEISDVGATAISRQQQQYLAEIKEQTFQRKKP